MCSTHLHHIFFTVGAWILLGQLNLAFASNDLSQETSFLEWAEQLKMNPQTQGTTMELLESKCMGLSEIEDTYLTRQCFPQIFAFVSFSLSTEILEEMSKQLQQIGGKFVLRGLPGNSFQRLSEKIQELRKKGAGAGFLIDPEAFQIYDIKLVPTFVVAFEDQFHKISGTVSLDYAIDQIARREEFSELNSLVSFLRNQGEM